MSVVNLKEPGIDQKEALWEIALLHASQKLAEFQEECEAFEKKYDMTFSDFERKIRTSEQEVFELDEDYNAWKFAHEGMNYWKEKVEQLQKQNPSSAASAFKH